MDSGPTQERRMFSRFALAWLVAAGIATSLFTALPGRTQATSTFSGCRVVDGDTLRCGDERIRLLGIDAPELPGHCAQGRNCAPGNGFASMRSLSEALAPPLNIRRVGYDRYGRTLALVSGSRGDLSCWQLKRRQAIYKPNWDNGGRLTAICSSAR